MKVILSIKKKKHLLTYTFFSITEAYHFYIQNFATGYEWHYYWDCCHESLDEVNNEDLMRSLFIHVFRNACLTIKNS